jgi:hypothetical protein
VAVVLVAVYSANGEVLPGTDAVPNVYLAANVLEVGRLTFTAARDPRLFSWALATPRGPVPARVFDLRADLGGETAAALAARGALVPDAPYFLVPTARPAGALEWEYAGRYGVGAALSAVPVLAAVRIFTGSLLDDAGALWHGAKLAASLMAALGAAVLYLTLRQWLTPPASLLLAAAYALGTPVWSLSSQTLWQHASNELFLAMGAYFLVRRGSAWHLALAGLSFAAAAACRPTSALFAVAAVAYLAVSDRRSLPAFLAGCLPLALALGAYNQHFLGSPFRFGQSELQDLAAEKTGVASVWQANPVTALAGLLVSPSRGLLVFSPFLALAAPGAWLAWRRAQFAALRPLLLGAALVLAVDLAWFDWWGGWSYGWRRLVDLAPAFTLFLVPPMAWVQARRWRTVAFALLVSHAVALQAVGAFAYDPEAWNARRAWRVSEWEGSSRTVLEEEEARRAAASGAAVVPVSLNVDEAEHRHRLWSVRDGQIVYLLTHFGEAYRGKREASRDWIAFWNAPGR